MDDETADMEQDKLILANLSIVKNNPIPVQYQVRDHEIVSPDHQGETRMM